MPVTVIPNVEVCKRNWKIYKINNNHTDILSVNGYLNLQGHKERDTTVIQTSYKYILAYTLTMLPAPRKFEPLSLAVEHFFS